MSDIMSVDVSFYTGQMSAFNDDWEKLFLEVEKGYTGDPTDDVFSGPNLTLWRELRFAQSSNRFFVPTKRQIAWIDNTIARSKITVTKTAAKLEEERKQLIYDVIGVAVAEFNRCYSSRS